MIHKKDDEILSRYTQIANVLGEMFSPFLETVVHDLRQPERSIITINNPHITNRKIGDPATKRCVERLEGKVPDTVVNMEKEGADGRELKSSSVSIRNEENDIIGVLSLNMDTSVFKQVHSSLSVLLEAQPVQVKSGGNNTKGNFPGSPKRDIQYAIQDLILTKGWSNKTLSSSQKRLIVQGLFKQGELNKRGAVTIISNELGVSRPSVYNYIRTI